MGTLKFYDWLIDGIQTSKTVLPERRLSAENSRSIEPAQAVHVSFSLPVLDMSCFTPYRRFTWHTHTLHHCCYHWVFHTVLQVHLTHAHTPSLLLSLVSVCYHYLRPTLNSKPDHEAKLCLSVCLSMYLCLSVYVSVCLSVCLSLCLSVYLRISLSICLSLCLSVCLSIYVSLSVCLSMYLSVSLSVCLSACLSMYLCLSIYLSLSVCLSI